MNNVIQNIKDSVSEEQFAVTQDINDNNVVVALPGSGKTHSIKFAIQSLLYRFPDARPLIVTFTNAAAGELADRLSKHLSESDYAKCHVSTFDSLMIELSKEIDQRQVIVGSSQTPYIYRAYNFMLDVIDSNDSFEDVCADIYDYGRNGKGTKGDTFSYKVYEKYCEILSNVGTYGVRDLNMVAHQVMEATKKKLLKKLAYSHIIVDEFQDTDMFQLNWLLFHGKKGVKVTVVGDDDQAIYSWRGARGYRNMKALVDVLDAKTHVFSECRRCRPEIIESAGKLIEFNLTRLPKKMRSSRNAGGKVHFLSFENKYQQENKLIEFLQSNKNNIGILARQNSHLEDLEKALVIHDIPYEKISGKTFYELFEVVAILHLLKAITNSSATESLAHAISYFGEGEAAVGEVTKLAKMYGSARIGGGHGGNWTESTIEILKCCALWQGKVLQSDIAYLSDALYRKILQWKPAKNKRGRSKTGVVASVLFKRISSSNEPLRKTVAKLTQHLNSFEVEDEEGKSKRPKKVKPLVCLSTLHSSKGLEWPIVWMLSFNEGVLPSSEGNQDIALLEEERRLAFVGMTRAEDMLVISSSNKVSAFLTESFPDVYSDDTDWVREPIIECEF